MCVCVCLSCVMFRGPAITLTILSLLFLLGPYLKGNHGAYAYKNTVP